MQKGLVPKARITTGTGRKNRLHEEVRALAREGFLSLTVLTVRVFAFTDDPEVQQGHALFQQGVGVFHADPVDVLHAELQLPSQLCKQRPEAGGEPRQSQALAPQGGAVEGGIWRGVPGIKGQSPRGFGSPSYPEVSRETEIPASLYLQKVGQEEECSKSR